MKAGDYLLVFIVKSSLSQNEIFENTGCWTTNLGNGFFKLETAMYVNSYTSEDEVEKEKSIVANRVLAVGEIKEGYILKTKAF